ncbi:hypothetical protein PRIPAC_84015 [Pristionchus pacificus]|uniref:Uncharacterized protein n=1 Tax=Pristionchus pacificus TaxID=54126 RepID=A0A454XR30_PRIPA|nr:hypothetical protein PRIPAC_84015 [Pristionchus pacificus]|eukprot:PDM69042.1 hypothetical protein PRIPAC_47344 [Pristionchus pacificus]
MSALYILFFLAYTKTVASSTCYSPVNLTVRYEVLSKTIAARSQLDCDKQCTDNYQCSAIVVDRKTDHVVCVFLGTQVPATICTRPTEAYRKMECAEPDGLPDVGCFGPAGLDACRTQLTGPSRLATGGVGLADLDGPVTIEVLVRPTCEMHFLLQNGTSIYRKFVAVHPVMPIPTNYTFLVDGVVDGWGYCQEDDASG